MKKIILLLLLVFSCSFSQEYNKDFPVLNGYYFGQIPPGNTPVLFAPEFLYSEMGFHSSIIFSSDLTEAYWSPMEKNNSVLWYSKMKNGIWDKPEILNLGIDNSNSDFALSPDGKKLYFLSFHKLPNESFERERIWFVERNSNEWSEAKLIDKVIYMHPTHWTFSIAKNGNLYFTSEKPDAGGIYVSKYKDHRYETPQKLFDGSMPFISPNESYIIYVLKKEKSKTDLYIRFKIGDNSWSEVIDMGPTVNSDAHDLAPYVSPDSKFLFFISQRERMNGIMWMSTEIINVLNQDWLEQLKK